MAEQNFVALREVEVVNILLLRELPQRRLFWRRSGKAMVLNWHWPKQWRPEEQLTQDRGTHSSVCLLYVSSQLNGFIASQLLPQLKSWLDAVPEEYCAVQGARVIIAPSNSREILNWQVGTLGTHIPEKRLPMLTILLISVGCIFLHFLAVTTVNGFSF